jgi:hypothetical protein
MYSGGVNAQPTTAPTGAPQPFANASAPPAGTYTPIPGSSPAAVIDPAGISAPAGSGTPPPATSITTTQVHTGSDAAVFGQLFSNYNAGDYRYNGLCQRVTVPAGATPVFNAYVLAAGNEASHYVEDMVAVIDSTSTQQLDNILYMENVVNSSANPAVATSGDTAFRNISFNLPSAYSGTTFTLFIGMWTSSGSSSGATLYSSYWMVDDVSLIDSRAPGTMSSARRPAATIRR